MVNVNTYDYIVAGGGAAGLSFLWRIGQSSLRHRRILLLDKAPKLRNDRTWCFWTREPTSFDDIIAHRWDRMAYRDDRGERVDHLRSYQYQLLRGIDFYRHTQAALTDLPKLDIRYGNIQEVGEDQDGAFVIFEGEKIRASWVFNSCYAPPAHLNGQGPRAGLLQHFLGWTVRAEREVFDPHTPVLMDFREEQGDFAHFYYLLPFSSREALVELTFFSPSVLPKATYRDKLDAYLRRFYLLDRYEQLEEEYGVIPMQGGPVNTAPHPHVVRLGTLGGAVKPTTGYAFLRIQQQTRQIVQQMEAGQPPRPPAWRHDRFAFYDDLLLHILREQGHLGKAVFSRLFHHNPMDRILTFLNEQSNLAQEGLLFSTLPKRPFFQAIWALYGTTGTKTWIQPFPG